MIARPMQGKMTRMSLRRRSWLALPLAILSNALLFYLLASVRTTPAAPRVDDKPTRPTALVHMPISNPTERDTAPPQPDSVSVVVAPKPIVKPATIFDAASIPMPRLLHRPQAMNPELPGLPVILPGRADLRSTPTPSAFAADLPHTLSGVDSPPRRIAGAMPKVPLWARRAHREGEVVLRFIVTAQGNVTNVNVNRVQGDERFGREASRKVATWRFEPATKRGKPVSCWCFQKISFNLDD